jgi:hypothetical protein
VKVSADKLIRKATVFAAIYILCFGIAQAFFPIRPFWNDEWRLLYNIKFRDMHRLWQTLDLLQQCPRVYLSLLKYITASFDYCYTSIRLPSLVITTASMALAFRLHRRIFPLREKTTYLFLLILFSSQTFTDYLVQVKQYELEIFLCLVVLWQLLTLLDVCDNARPPRTGTMILLCLSFAVAPFFSYTYPIAVAPLFPILLFRARSSFAASHLSGPDKRQLWLSILLPLAIAIAAIVVFYIIDVRQLMADSRMYQSYRRMLGSDKEARNFAEDLWQLFSLVGSGLIFEVIFGVVGITSFVYGLYTLAGKKWTAYTLADHLKAYAIILLMLVLALFISGRLLGGVARLTAFSVPSIALLIVLFFDDVRNRYRYTRLANIITTILFLGLFGNIISTFIATFTFPKYANRIRTYWRMSDALKMARTEKLPFIYTDGVRGDVVKDTTTAAGHIMANTITPEQIAGVDVLCDEVIVKVDPEYKTWDTVAVFQAPDMKWMKEYVQQLPPQYTSAIVCDGINYYRIVR